MNIDNYTPVRQKRDTILSILQDVAALIGDSSSTVVQSQTEVAEKVVPVLKLFSEAASLINCSKALQQGLFTVALLGESIHLKGLLGSALLGNKMLANRYIPVPVNLVYGGRVNIAIYEADKKQPRMATWKTFVDELQQHVNGATHINCVQIERQLPLLAAGVRLIDFPSLVEINRRRNVADTLLKQADAFILVLGAENPLFEDTLSLVKAVLGLERLSNVFFAVNLDNPMIPATVDTTKKKIQQILQQYFLDEQGILDHNLYNQRVFFLDARAALEAHTALAQDSEKLAVSGMIALEEEIARYLTTNDRIAQKLEPTLKLLRSVVSKALAQIANEKAYLSQQQQEAHISTETKLRCLHTLEKKLTELVRKANVSVYDVSRVAPAQNQPRSKVKSTVKASKRRPKLHDEPDPLRVWIDADDHLQFATQVVQRPDVPASIRTEIQERIDQIRRREADPYLYMAIVGEFSSGKSTFINALLRQELLATSVLPTTATQTQFRYGPELDVTIAFKTLPEPLSYHRWSTDIWQHIRSIAPEIGISPLDIHSCIQFVTANELVASHVTNVVIHHPAPFLEDGVVIVDTPGVNALNEQHAKITYDLVEKAADSAVIMIPAPIPLASTLTGFLTTQLKPFLHRCLFVVTQMDRIREREQPTVIENIHKRLTTVLNLDRPVTLYDCAAQAVLDMLEEDSTSPEMIHWNDRFQELEEIFFDRLRRERMLSIAESLLRLLNQLFELLDEYLRNRWSSYELQEAAIESDVIQDLKSFAREQHSIYQGKLTRSVSQIRKKIENCIGKQKEIAKEKIRKALFDATDVNGLQAVLTQQADVILENVGQTISKELQQLLTKLAADAEQAGQAFDEEFTKEYRRLRAVSGLLVANDPSITKRGLSLDVSNVLSSARQLNQQFTNKEDKIIGGGALGGAVIGTAIMPVVGTLIGLFAGGILGAMFGPSLDKRKASLWEQLEPKLNNGFDVIQATANSKLDAYAQELSVALDKRIDKYIARYKTTVDNMIRDQQSELAELNRLQFRIEEDRKEINRRRTLLQQKQKELANKVI